MLATPSPAPSSYTGKFLGLDTETSGNWVGTYGKDGYVLINGDETITTVRPPYVTSVDVKARSQVGVWAANTTDTRALEQPPGSTKARSAACWTYGTSLDVSINTQSPTQPLCVSFYVVDWDSNDRRMTAAPQYQIRIEQPNQ